MTFRDRLFATIQAARSVLEDPGVLVVGSEVPNLLEPGAAATLVVPEPRHSVRSNLTLLSPVEARTGMPDPGSRRAAVARLLRRLEIGDGGLP